MPELLFATRGIDPLLFRDGRPFAASEGDETMARSLTLPLPHTLAGFLRAQAGATAGWDWNRYEDCQAAHGVPVYGPLPRRAGQFVFPAPRDAVVYANDNVIGLRPWSDDLPDAAGCDLPEELAPLRLTEEQNGKPASGHAFWEWSALAAWLEGRLPAVLPAIAPPPVEERIHVAIASESGRSKEGALFSVGYRACEEWEFVARANLPDNLVPAPVGHLGGERRLGVVETLPDTDANWPRCPPSLKTALRAAKRVRLTLATPALFAHGWRPGWLDDGDSGPKPRGLSKVRLKLVAAAVGRREPVSGWSLRASDGAKGARPVRWAVPAGSTFFFHVVDGGSPDALFEEGWLRPVSDRETDRKDGFGLALWGVW